MNNWSEEIGRGVWGGSIGVFVMTRVWAPFASRLTATCAAHIAINLKILVLLGQWGQIVFVG